MAKLVPLTSFYHLLLPHIPNVPTPTLAQALRLAAIDFSERTRAWRHIKTLQLNKQGQGCAAPPYAVIHEIEWAEFDGERLVPMQFTDVDQTEMEQTGVPCYITQVEPDTIAVVPFSAGQLKLSVFIKPRHEVEWELNENGEPYNIYDQVPQYYLSNHAETLTYGGLHRLFAMPKKDWSNARLAAMYFTMFKEKCDEQFQTTNTGQQDAPTRIDPHFF